MNKKIKSVAVYCGHQAGNNPEYIRDAKKIGELLARNKITLVFGGGNVGLMGAVSSAALENGGQVIGISTTHVLSLQEPAHKEIDVKVVDGLSTRKQEMYDLSDAFIILPGGMGTLDEMTDIMTKQQVGESCKPIFLMNTAKYWEIFGDIMVLMQTEGFMPNPDDYNLHIVNTPEELIQDLTVDSDRFFTKCKAL
ncbi:MAG: TIGR00730 family Rossman fold protein [Alphaproteobacteria bacterium]|nr:TIGR00730 family Rossman fold protein [Alphaproteobacteria bacterium]